MFPIIHIFKRYFKGLVNVSYNYSFLNFWCIFDEIDDPNDIETLREFFATTKIKIGNLGTKTLEEHYPLDFNLIEAARPAIPEPIIITFFFNCIV